MKRTTMFKMFMMMALIAGAMTLTRPAQANMQVLDLSCTTQCISSSGVNHACTATLLGIPLQFNVGINQPVEACGPIGSMVFDPVTQQVCGLTPDAVVGITVPIQDECGSYEIIIPTANTFLDYEAIVE
jgi:hypothetical protein